MLFIYSDPSYINNNNGKIDYDIKFSVHVYDCECTHVYTLCTYYTCNMLHNTHKHNYGFQACIIVINL